jgi:hypothetical protein
LHGAADFLTWPAPVLDGTAFGRRARRRRLLRWEKKAVMSSLDSFKCAKTLVVGAKTYVYYSLPEAEKHGLRGISRLPFSMKVLLENLLRNEDGRTVTKEDIQGFAQWLKAKTSDREIAFAPRAC